MSFLLRAALVIGALSYLAATRDHAGPISGGSAATAMPGATAAAQPASIAAASVLAAAGSASAAWSALPADARQRLAQDAMSEVGRHLGTATLSRDTLAETDRKAAWRGAETR